MDFPYPCPCCSNLICRRVYTICLAMGEVDEQYCLECLSRKHNQSKEDLFNFIYPYLISRDCFKKEWVKMKDKSECPLVDRCVIQQCFK